MSVAQKSLGSAARRNTRRQFLQVESLEDRKMMALTALSVDGGGTLIIRGDDQADTISVFKSGMYTMVQANGGTFNLGANVYRMDIRTNGGNDTVNNLANMNAVIYGGTGNDTLNGGTIDDALFGEAGNDTLTGNGATDTLYGGAGNDALYGNDGNDRLFGEAGYDWLSGGAHDDFIDSGAASEGNWAGGEGNDFNAWSPVVNGAAFNDIDQRDSNNCFILGPMGEAAQHGLNIASRITYAGNGNYDVALFSKGPAGNYVPTSVRVAFDGRLNATDPAPHFRSQEGESWTVIMNRGIAQHLGVNLATVKGGYAGDVFGAIYGRAPTTVTWSDASGALSMYQNDPMLDYLYVIGNSRPAIVSTHNAAARDATRFVASHVYMVHSVAVTGYIRSPYNGLMIPQYTVVLYNPHGEDILNAGYGGFKSTGSNTDGIITLSGAEFKRSFAEITTN